MNPDAPGQPPDASAAPDASAPRETAATNPGSSLPNEPARAGDPPADRESMPGGSDDAQ